MRILVSGGAGFLGSHLCERLLKEGHEVFCIDSFMTGSPRNIASFRNHPKFQLIEHDITLPLKHSTIRNEDLRFLENREGRIDQIYHLAAPSAPVDEQDIPLQIMWICAAGTKNMLELAIRHDASFLLASSSAIYGSPLHPDRHSATRAIAENFEGYADPLGPQSALCEGKRYAESLAFNYYRHYRFGLKIARLFASYGPRMRRRDGSLLSEWLHAAQHHETLRVPAGIEAVSLCYVEDMVEGLIQCMNSPKEFIGPVNLGNPRTEKPEDVARLLLKNIDSMSQVQQGADRGADLKIPDISLAREKLGFVPRLGLEEGLKKTLATL